MRTRFQLSSPAIASLMALAACATAQVSPSLANEEVPKTRLPADVRPTAYRLHLELDPARDGFQGSEEIDLSLAQPRNRIWINAKALQLSKVKIASGGTTQDATATIVDPDDGVARIDFADAIPAGPAVLSVSFAGLYDTHADGLYKVVVDSEPYLFTQFESVVARAAFPCFDEPGFKAPLTLDLVVPKGMVTAANAPIDREEPADAGNHVTFKPTLPLPTYLYAWVVGHFDVVDAAPVAASAIRPAPVPLRGIATKGHGKDLAYVMARAGKMLSSLEDYFGIAYPYGKLDLVAVPDFQAGAMENAGLITFREELLFVDEQTSPLRVKRSFVGDTAHEMAHQWFGDLVTLAWWDDVWLNESFAEWISTPISDLAMPGQGFPLAGKAEGYGAMAEDGMVSARKIRQPILSLGDVVTAFDGITYAKGQAVIGMFERWVGPEKFRQGIHNYLEHHRGGNATVDDLLTELSSAAGKDVATPFKTFLDQAGVPNLQVIPHCDAGKGSLEIHQSRFLPVGSTGDRNQLWQVPFCARVGRSDTQVDTVCSLLTTATSTVDLGGCPTFVHPNAEGAGYYRWSLPGDALKTLAAHRGQLSEEERLAFVNALGAGFNAATMPAADVLAALLPLATDEEPTIAGAPSGVLDFIVSDVPDDQVKAAARKEMKTIYEPILTKIGLAASQGEDRKITDRRSLAYAELVRGSEDPEALKAAAKLGRAYLGIDGDGKIHPEVLEPSLVGVAVGAAGRLGDAKLFDQLLARLAEEQNPLVRERILETLASTQDPALSERAMALSLDPRLRSNEIFNVLFGYLSDYRTRDRAWTWFKEHYDPLMTRIPAQEANFVAYAGSGFCSEEGAKDVEAFFTPKLSQIQGLDRSLAQVLETIRLCHARLDAQQQSARDFFNHPRPN